MPITGQESALASQMRETIRIAIEAQFGGSIRDPEYILALTTGIANALIPFLVANTQVNTGQSVLVPGLGLTVGMDPVTGVATGTVDTPGTIS